MTHPHEPPEMDAEHAEISRLKAAFLRMPSTAKAQALIAALRTHLDSEDALLKEAGMDFREHLLAHDTLRLYLTKVENQPEPEMHASIPGICAWFDHHVAALDTDTWRKLQQQGDDATCLSAVPSGK